MEFYLSIEGKKKGPYTQFRVEEMLRDGELSHKNLAWHREMDKWLPVSEIPALMGIMKREVETDLEDDATEAPGSENILAGEDDFPEGGGSEAVATLPPLPGIDPKKPVRKLGIANEVKPFVRFWARTFDYMLVAAMVILFSDIEIPTADPGMTLQEMTTHWQSLMQSPETQLLGRLLFFALLLWHVVEALMINVFGTTPGKALFGIRIVTNDGQRPGAMACLARSFFVYVLGVGIYLFPFSIIAMTFSFFRLMATGKTIWDHSLKMVVEHPPMGFVRILLAIGAFFVLITLQSLKFS